MLIINVNYSYYSVLLFRLSLSEKREISQAKTLTLQPGLLRQKE